MCLRQLLARQPRYIPWGPLLDPMNGALVKTIDDPSVYLVTQKRKYRIDSEKVFRGLGFQWSWVEDVDAALLEPYRAERDITEPIVRPDNTIFKYKNDTRIFMLLSGKKRHVESIKTLRGMQFRLDRIPTILDAEQYPNAEAIL